jgi:hypothetical protein
MKTDVFPIDELSKAQVDRVRLLKTTRDNDAVRAALDDVPPPPGERPICSIR